jgi:hypothetical protein
MRQVCGIGKVVPRWSGADTTQKLAHVRSPRGDEGLIGSPDARKCAVGRDAIAVTITLAMQST